MNVNLIKRELIENKNIISLFLATLAIIFIVSFSSTFTANSNYNSYSNFYSMVLFSSTIVYGIALFASTLSQFDFLHNKSKIDFYHSLPITRKQLFLTKYLVPIISYTIPYLITNFILFLYTLYLSTFETLTPEPYISNLIYLIIMITLASLICYSFLVLMGMLSGKTIYQTILFFQTLVLGFAFVLSTFGFINTFINYGLDSFNIFLYTFDNLEHFTRLNLIIVIQILLIALFTFLSLRFYEKYKSEYSGKFLTTILLTKIYIVLTSFFLGTVLTSLLSMLFTYELTRNLYFSIGLMLFVITAFIFVALSVFINKKQFGIKSGIILAILNIMFLLICLVDIFGLANIVPNPDNTISATIDDSSSFETNDVIELQQLCIQNSVPYKDYYKSIANQTNEYTPMYFEYLINKNGSEYNFRRTYYVSLGSEDVFNKLNELYTSDSYKQNFIKSLESMKDEGSNLIAYADDIEISNPSKMYSLIDALIEDIENDDTFGYYNEQPVTLINLSLSYYILDNEYFRNYITLDKIPLNYKYTNTLEVIDKSYKEQFGENSSILDNYAITVLDSSYLDDIKTKANNQNIQLIPSSDFIYDTESDQLSNQIYYRTDKEEFLELLKTNVYTTFDNSILKLSDDYIAFNSYSEGYKNILIIDNTK